MNKKSGIATNTIIHRSSLTKTDNKYILDKKEKKEVRNINSLRSIFKKNKYKCFNCRYSKNLLFCLKKSEDILPSSDLCECKYFSKL